MPNSDLILTPSTVVPTPVVQSLKPVGGILASKKEQQKLAAKTWRLANPERCKLYSKKWRTLHPDDARLAAKRWRLNHPEQYKAAQKVRSDRFRKKHLIRIRAESRVRSKSYRLENAEVVKAKAREHSRKYRLANPQKVKASCAAWTDKNREASLLYQASYRAKHRASASASSKKWYQEHRNIVHANFRTRYKADANFRLLANFRNRLRKVIKGRRAISSVDMLGCSVEQFREHIERSFKPGMTWENHGAKGWHIDHIRPCASFDLSNLEQQRQCFHYTNLQPLWHLDNLAKGSWYDGKCYRSSTALG